MTASPRLSLHRTKVPFAGSLRLENLAMIRSPTTCRCRRSRLMAPPGALWLVLILLITGCGESTLGPGEDPGMDERIGSSLFWVGCGGEEGSRGGRFRG